MQLTSSVEMEPAPFGQPLPVDREFCAHDGILEVVGDTPLVRLRKYADTSKIRLWAKLESVNPAGSAKDRPARQMIGEALRAGVIHRGSVVIESSSGNMGIGLAQACRYHGLRFICVVDSRAQPHNLKIIQAYGAEIQRVDRPDPSNGDFLTARLNRVRELLEEIPHAYWPNQYANRNNPEAHAQGTMAEIDQALRGEVDYLFVATSTTGTASGCASYVRSHRLRTTVVAVDSQGSVLFGGQSGSRKISGLGAGQVLPLAREATVGTVIRVSDLDCVLGCRRLAHREAILAGGSSGGVLEAIRRVASDLPRGANCVAILHDSGTRYLDTVYDDAWVERELGCSPARLRELVGHD